MPAATADKSQLESLNGWKTPPRLVDLLKDRTAAQTAHDSQVIRVSTWLDNLNVTGAARIKTPDGASKIVPKLIRKQAEWRYSALSEPFLNTDTLFKASPVSWEDKKAAQQNALVLNHQFNTKIDRVSFFDDYVRTAVDEGTVIVRIGWEFEEETREVEVPVVAFSIDPQMAELHEQLHQMMASDPNGYARDVPEELQMAHEESMRTGQPLRPQVTGTTLEPMTRTTVNRPTLEVCDYRNVITDPSCRGDMSKAGFIIYSFESSLSKLRKENKYKNLDFIHPTQSTLLGDPDHATEDQSDFNFDDEARKKFIVYEYWGYWDYDDSGIALPFVAAWVGNTLIRMEANPFPDKKLPFVSTQYLPVRRRVHGEPDGHLLEDNQKVAGAVVRGMIDLMAKSANSQTGTRKDALDITNRRKFDKGQDYEFNAHIHPDQAIYTHKYPEIPQSAQYMLNLQNLDAEAMTGVKSFSGGISGDSLGSVATGVRGALDAASKRELAILRRLAQGIIKIGRKIVAMNGEFLEEEEVVRVTNEEFVKVRKDELAGEFDLTLTISTAEEDNAKAQELSFMLQTVGPKSPPEMTNMIMADIARLRRMPELAKKLEEYQPQPDPMEEEIKMLTIEKLKAEVAEINARAMRNEADAMLDQAKAVTEGSRARHLSSAADKQDLDFVEQESGVTQERELQKQGEQARGNIALEKEKARLAAGTQTRDALMEYLKNPR